MIQETRAIAWEFMVFYEAVKQVAEEGEEYITLDAALKRAKPVIEKAVEDYDG